MAVPKLLVNVALSFVAGFATAFGAFIAATPKNPGTSAIIAAAAAAVYAGFRLAVGAAAAGVAKPFPVDA